MISPSIVVKTCKLKHRHNYRIADISEQPCQTAGCTAHVNPSRVFRETSGKTVHPYLVWTADDVIEQASGSAAVVTVIPMTSSEAHRGHPSSYPIQPNTTNGLSSISFALCHQILTVDLDAFKDPTGLWKPRLGQVEIQDRREIAARLAAHLGFETDEFTEAMTNKSVSDWFQDRTAEEQMTLLEELLNLSKK